VAAIDKVLIVGGGVAGMSCAIQMRKRGIEVDLIDIDANWRSYGAGITVTGPTLRALQTIGVLNEVTAAGATWNNMKVLNQAGEYLTDVQLAPLAADLPATGGIMRPVLHRILSAKTVALGARVRLATTLTDLTDAGDQVQASFSDGSTSRYDLVVGADGIFSRLRERIFPQAPKPTFTGQVIYRVVAERPPGFDCTHFFMGADSKVGFNPVSPTHMYMFLLHRAEGDPRIDPASPRRYTPRCRDSAASCRRFARRCAPRMPTASTTVCWRCC